MASDGQSVRSCHGDVVEIRRRGRQHILALRRGGLGDLRQVRQGGIGQGDLRGDEASVGFVAAGVGTDASEHFQQRADGASQAVGTGVVLPGDARRSVGHQRGVEPQVGHQAVPRPRFDGGAVFGCFVPSTCGPVRHEVATRAKLAERWVIGFRHGIRTFRAAGRAGRSRATVAAGRSSTTWQPTGSPASVSGASGF
jgi:hypothetical protein